MTDSCKNYIARRIEGRRLAYYGRMADSDFWDKHWEGHLGSAHYMKAKRGDLGRYEFLFSKYLPRHQPILEAGCGLGQIVLGLHAKGYQVEGVDWAKSTVNKVKNLFPDLHLYTGDVCNLPVQDNTYGAYISFGVIEHRYHGPEPFLREAFRVLAPSGIALISVPWFNPLRKLKYVLGCYVKEVPENAEFYQFALGSREMRRLLRDAGFEMLETWAYDSRMGFEDELPFLEHYYASKIPGGRLLRKHIRQNQILERRCGHMLMFVCRKPAEKFCCQ